MCASKLVGGHVGKSAWRNSEKRMRGASASKSSTPRCQEKSLIKIEVPVPQTDTGRLAEHAKARGESLLRNSANYPRNFGRRGPPYGLGFAPKAVRGRSE